jgi:hypothetical protein
MPKSSWQIGLIVIEKTVKDGKKLRKMSTGVQIWTRLNRLKVAKLTGIKGQIEALVRCIVAQVLVVCPLPRKVFGVSQ